MAPERGRAGALLLAAPAVLMWGLSFIAVKMALHSVSPFGLVAVRAVLGAALLGVVLPFLPAASPVPRRKGDFARLAILSVQGLPLQVGLQAYALTLTSAVHAGWLIALIPVFTALLSALFLGERFPLPKVLGTGLGFAGALLVIGGVKGAAALGLPSGRGDLLILLSALNWALYTLQARTLLRRMAPLALTVRVVLGGAAIVTAAYLLLGTPSELAGVTAAGWAALVFLGAGCTGAAYLLWSAALSRLEPGTLTSVQYVQPLVTAVAAAAWLGEPAGGTALVGGGLVLVGVVLVQRFSP